MQNQTSSTNTSFLTVSVNSEDIHESGVGLLSNPIARALSRTTQRRWRVWDGRVAQEAVAPHRVIDLPSEVWQAWEEHTDFTNLPPFTFQVEIDDEPKSMA